MTGPGKRRRAIMGSYRGVLPTEYQAVEYISSDGHQRLAITNSAPYATTAKATIEIRTKPSKTSSSAQCILGDYSNFTCDWQNGVYTGWKSSVISQDIDESDSVIWETIARSTSGYITKYSVFSYRDNQLTYPYAGKIYSIKISIDPPFNITNILIPCYRKSDGVIGMYSTHDKKFYTNLGSGTFEKGADVK